MVTCKGVLFDAMNTVIYPNPPVFEAYHQAALRHGADLDPQLIQDRFGRAFAEDEKRDREGDLATSEEREVQRWHGLVSNVLFEVENQQALFDDLWFHFAQPCHWACYPDVEATLRLLNERGVPWSIASNFDCRLRSVLNGMPEIINLQKPLAISSEIGWKKPSALFYQAASHRLGLTLESILFVGDDPINDVEGAIQAGMQACLIDRQNKHSGSTWPVIGNLQDITRFLQ